MQCLLARKLTKVSEHFKTYIILVRKTITVIKQTAL